MVSIHLKIYVGVVKNEQWILRLLAIKYIFIHGYDNKNVNSSDATLDFYVKTSYGYFGRIF